MEEGLEFDKDDANMMDFVASAANLRAHIFSIPTKTRFDVKQMAGNIIPAVATSNAVVAGLQVLMAFRLLSDDHQSIHTTYLANSGSGKLLQTETLQKPSLDCGVCSMDYSKIVIDCESKTLGVYLESVVREQLGLDGDVTILRGHEYVNVNGLSVYTFFERYMFV